MKPNLVKGSLSDVAKKEGQSLASGFLNVKAFVMVDVSGSMQMGDAAGGRSRYDAACDQLADLQAANAGEIAVACFSGKAQFSPGGVPVMMGGTTDMVAALKMLKMADNTGIRLILISDGEPDDRSGALRAAEQFTSKIDTIYIGPEDGHGREFLRRLSEATGGISIFNQTAELGKLSDNITMLLGAGA